MPNMTLAIPADMKTRMDRFKEINWSEVARQAIQEKMAMFEKMNSLLSQSRLAEPKVEYHAAKVKKNVAKKYRA